MEDVYAPEGSEKLGEITALPLHGSMKARWNMNDPRMEVSWYSPHLNDPKKRADNFLRKGGYFFTTERKNPDYLDILKIRTIEQISNTDFILYGEKRTLRFPRGIGFSEEQIEGLPIQGDVRLHISYGKEYRESLLKNIEKDNPFKNTDDDIPNHAPLEYSTNPYASPMSGISDQQLSWLEKLRRLFGY